MSDFIQGTLIGGAIGIIGSIAVSIIQIRASNGAQRMLFKFENNQKIIERRIKLRQEWCKPLSTFLQEFNAALIPVRSNLELLIAWYPKGPDSVQVIPGIVDYNTTAKELCDNIIDEIPDLVRSIHKNLLGIRDKELEIGLHSLLSIRFQLQFYCYGVQKNGLDTIKYDHIDKKLSEATKVIIEMNNRIEKILCGETDE